MVFWNFGSLLVQDLCFSLVLLRQSRLACTLFCKFVFKTGKSSDFQIKKNVVNKLAAINHHLEFSIFGSLE